MKICIIGPGIMEIPPVGWGAVEILIWDIYCFLKNTHDIDIINIIRNCPNDSNENTKYSDNLVDVINSKQYDFIHIHYDCLYHIIPKLKCKNIAITSHYPYISNSARHDVHYSKIFDFLIRNTGFYNFVLTDKDFNTFIECGSSCPMRRISNGINDKLFLFSDRPIYENKTIWLGKIEERKKQYLYQEIKEIDFVGPVICNKFVKNSNYIGEWTRDQVHKNLCNYPNLVLLSEGEADPLVIKEALICGLGIVCNKISSENLDIMPFIDIIPNDLCNNIEHVKNILDINRKKSITMRHDIRNYGIEKFGIETQCNKYIGIIKDIIK